MSDEKRFEKMMTDHVDRTLYREWQNKYSPKAVQQFVKPARVCSLCGIGMTVNPVDGRNYTIDEWERKWSVHHHCAQEAQKQLDDNDRYMFRK